MGDADNFDSFWKIEMFHSDNFNPQNIDTVQFLNIETTKRKEFSKNIFSIISLRKRILFKETEFFFARDF